MGDDRTLTTRQRRFVAALLSEKTVTAAAEAAKVAPRTAWNYLADDAVRAELARRQDGILGHVSRRLATEMETALDVLHEVMVNADAPDAPRVSAARAVLDGGLKLAELVALAERVSQLEERMAKDVC